MLTRARGTIVVVPAVVWLGIFFLLPLALILVVSLGSRDELGRIVLENPSLDNYRRAFNPDYLPTLVTGAAVRGAHDGRVAAHRLPDRVLGLTLRRTPEDPPAAPFDASVLDELAHPDLRLDDHPARQRRGELSSSRRSASRANRSSCSTPTSRSMLGMTYGFLPFMILPIFVSIDRLDSNLVAAARDLYASGRKRVPPRHAAAVDAGRHRGGAADVHPGDGRLRHAGPPRRRPADDHRQGHPGAVPRRTRLAVRISARVHPDRVTLVGTLVALRTVRREIVGE